ncbi:MAG: hypothetical protein IJU39_05195 [Clostridia bacterium]|nr:hypothetical protein [Clostridia bacterium]
MLAITVFSPIYLVYALFVSIMLGKTVLFKQPRPGIELWGQSL